MVFWSTLALNSNIFNEMDYMLETLFSLLNLLYVKRNVLFYPHKVKILGMKVNQP